MSGGVRVIPLGGTGEIGKNMYVIEMDDRMIIVDCGVTFPRNEQPGVDLVLPDFSYVEENRDRLDAVVLTHGHEDHIGALPYLVRKIGGVPVFSAKFTLGLVRSKLDEHGLLDQVDLIDVEPGGREYEIGPFQARFVALTHSIPECMAVALKTPLGYVVHTGDFRIDPKPVPSATRTDLAGLARLGEEGVVLLLADSTNANETAPVPAESNVGEAMARIFARAPGRVLVTTFSSHIHRVQQLLDAAYHDGRSVALVGRSLNRNAGIARNLGILTVPGDILTKPRELSALPLDEQVIMCTGSQGEPLAALSRMARGEHPQVTIGAGDTVVFSSSTVPGNELAVNDTINRLSRLRATVITESEEPSIHASGHGSSGDLLLMLELMRPKHFAPIHGEPRHQFAHADLGATVGVDPERTYILENGDVLEVDADGGGVVDRVETGLTFVDRQGADDVAEEVMRDRRHLSEDGIVLVVASVGAEDGAPLEEVEIVSRGFAPADEELIGDLRRAARESLDESAEMRVTEVGVLQHRLHDAVASVLRERTGQSPMVLPVVLEV